MPSTRKLSKWNTCQEKLSAVNSDEQGLLSKWGHAGRSEGWSYGDGVRRSVLALGLEGCMERGGAFWMGCSGVCVWEARLKKEPFQLHGTGIGKNSAVNYYKYTLHVQQGEEIVKEK